MEWNLETTKLKPNNPPNLALAAYSEGSIQFLLADFLNRELNFLIRVEHNPSAK